MNTQTITLNNYSIGVLENFNFADIIDNQEEKVNFITCMFHRLLVETKKELSNLFSSDELILMKINFTSFSAYSLLSSEILSKRYLCEVVTEIINSKEYLDYIQNVDTKLLFNKLNKLTEFQAFCLIYSLNELLDTALVKSR